jgi:hypothetical protein
MWAAARNEIAVAVAVGVGATNALCATTRARALDGRLLLARLAGGSYLVQLGQLRIAGWRAALLLVVCALARGLLRPSQRIVLGAEGVSSLLSALVAVLSFKDLIGGKLHEHAAGGVTLGSTWALGAAGALGAAAVRGFRASGS